jgi:8-oxo-dGTP pyrophosphatase MutT (NUDIX family)
MVLDCGTYLKVELHTVALPDGRVIDDWPWVITPDFVNVVAVTREGRYLCFRQTKYSLDGVGLAPVGGYIDDGEDALTAAQRELLEETGYTATRWEHLGSFPIDGNRGAGVGHFFLALDARPVAMRDADDLEEQDLRLLRRAEVEAALDQGGFGVLPWAAALALALRHPALRQAPASETP